MLYFIFRCKCLNCDNMLTVEESICCGEVDRVMNKMEEEELEGCITTHPGFQTVCLDRFVLQTAYFQYREQYGNMAQNQVHEYVYIFYRKPCDLKSL